MKSRSVCLRSDFMTNDRIQIMSEAFQRRLIMLYFMRLNGEEAASNGRICAVLGISEPSWFRTKEVFVKLNLLNKDNSLTGFARQFLVEGKDAQVNE